MKLSLLVLPLILLASCGGSRSTRSNPGVVTPPPAPNASVFNKWTSDSGLHGVNELDFTGVTLGELVPQTFCPGSLGNSGTMGPEAVPENMRLIDGDLDNGIIQYGHLPYVGISDTTLYNLCRGVSKERYTFTTTVDTLRICMVNYPFCADYTLVE